jgi:hypothetical protein
LSYRSHVNLRLIRIHFFAQLLVRRLHLHHGYHRFELRAELVQDDRDLRRGSFCTRYGTVIRYLFSWAPTTLDAGMFNTFGVHIRKHLNNISVWWHILGTTTIIIAILAAAPKHQSEKFVFRTFIDDTGVGGVGWSQRASPAYVAVIGILMAQYTLLGLVHALLNGVHFSD